jgi:hypothetical protein
MELGTAGPVGLRGTVKPSTLAQAAESAAVLQATGSAWSTLIGLARVSGGREGGGRSGRRFWRFRNINVPGDLEAALGAMINTCQNDSHCRDQGAILIFV